ncbi:hypothetical protein HYDPIDRAFT_170302 [Hydnomerulius pinastri MD-312]|uniref:Uncharacterized protein n=1 Tax=Hydnomerulius pinastri MD-312 TaxID=994086 RepID=A0A0C9WAP2_9AGAM|nr:hypothetical protein HYDPIDRAFT_170302 [Hydnomerulius pinastri MD-312]
MRGGKKTHWMGKLEHMYATKRGGTTIKTMGVERKGVKVEMRDGRGNDGGDRVDNKSGDKRDELVERSKRKGNGENSRVDRIREEEEDIFMQTDNMTSSIHQMEITAGLKCKWTSSTRSTSSKRVVVHTSSKKRTQVFKAPVAQDVPGPSDSSDLGPIQTWIEQTADHMKNAVKAHNLFPTKIVHTFLLFLLGCLIRQIGTYIADEVPSSNMSDWYENLHIKGNLITLVQALFMLEADFGLPLDWKYALEQLSDIQTFRYLSNVTKKQNPNAQAVVATMVSLRSMDNMNMVIDQNVHEDGESNGIEQPIENQHIHGYFSY